MDTKLTALALIRASIEEDADALQVMMSENPATPELVAELVCLSAGILEHGIGREEATATVDRWLRVVLAGSSATRARDAQ
ncbi:hypothetical protein ASG90_20570 [Nocardioides sp. Soil797]|nr:hypothetical protein ASG90_20570 [Nocardioides sp. Soil797]